MTVIKDSIDLGATDEERYRRLRRIVENVLEDTDPGVDRADRRRWMLWTLLYIMWHEGRGATTRQQGGGGPARGLMQFEPRTLWDLINYFIFGPAPGLIANLAAAAGVSPDEMREALDGFRAFADARDRNVWPNPTNGPATKIEEWLTTIDSFGIKLFRYYFRAQGDAHRFPPRESSDLTLDAQADSHKDQHAEHWARWWKKAFAGPDDEREKRSTFLERADQLDRIASRAESGSPGSSTPAPRGQCIVALMVFCVAVTIAVVAMPW
ncbi:MAG: hypothetical protein M9894_16360 [Planctomycetes bacterium]|nr:hypothetical protein [Planctomycetota bacterium]